MKASHLYSQHEDSLASREDHIKELSSQGKNFFEKGLDVVGNVIGKGLDLGGSSVGRNSFRWERDLSRSDRRVRERSSILKAGSFVETRS